MVLLQGTQNRRSVPAVVNVSDISGEFLDLGLAEESDDNDTFEMDVGVDRDVTQAFPIQKRTRKSKGKAAAHVSSVFLFVCAGLADAAGIV